MADLFRNDRELSEFVQNSFFHEDLIKIKVGEVWPDCDMNDKIMLYDKKQDALLINDNDLFYYLTEHCALKDISPLAWVTVSIGADNTILYTTYFEYDEKGILDPIKKVINEKLEFAKVVASPDSRPDDLRNDFVTEDDVALWQSKYEKRYNISFKKGYVGLDEQVNDHIIIKDKRTDEIVYEDNGGIDNAFGTTLIYKSKVEQFFKENDL